MIAARAHTIERLKEQICCNGDEGKHDSVYLPRLVAYCSKESHSCVEKAAKIALVKLRILEVKSYKNINNCHIIKTTKNFRLMMTVPYQPIHYKKLWKKMLQITWFHFLYQ